MKKILLGLFMAISVSAYSQIGITGYVENAVGVNYKFAPRLSADIKLITNNLNNLPFEVSLNYSFVKADNYHFYVGAGFLAETGKSDLINSLIIPVGYEVAPFESAKKLSFIVELSPTIGDNFVLNKFFGVRYSFGN